MSFAELIDACTDKGVTERPPVAGHTYLAFTTSPSRPRFHRHGSPGPVAIAIGHYDAGVDEYFVDFVRNDITIDEAASDLRRYGIDRVTGQTSEDYYNVGLAEAVCGVLAMLRRKVEGEVVGHA